MGVCKAQRKSICVCQRDICNVNSKPILRYACLKAAVGQSENYLVEFYCMHVC